MRVDVGNISHNIYHMPIDDGNNEIQNTRQATPASLAPSHRPSIGGQSIGGMSYLSSQQEKAGASYADMVAVWDMPDAELPYALLADVVTAHIVSLGPDNLTLLDLGRAPYVLYGVKYIDLVSLDGAMASQSQILT